MKHLAAADMSRTGGWIELTAMFGEDVVAPGRDSFMFEIRSSHRVVSTNHDENLFVGAIVYAGFAAET